MLKRYINGTANSAEKAIIEQAYNEMEAQQSKPLIKQEDLDSIGNTIYERIVFAKPKRTRSSPWYYGAAAVVLLGLVWWGWPKLIKTDLNQNNFSIEHIFPKNNVAIAILPNGQKIQLDSIKSGIDMSNRHFAYTDGSAIVNTTEWFFDETATLEILTPRGAQYHIILEDGTNVWINAGSTLKYPVHFAENERIVELTGEAFFEVKPQNINNEQENKHKPFIVKTARQRIAVLGTSFNVNEYQENPAAKTTLLSGKVKVSYPNNPQELILHPHEQSTFLQGKPYKEKVDAELISSWKDGYLSFDDASLAEVATYLSRWYDIDVLVKGNNSTDRFQGRISKKEPLSKILRILQESNVKYSLNKNTLTIYQ